MSILKLSETYTVEYFVYHPSLLEHSEKEYFEFAYSSKWDALVKIEEMRQYSEVHGLKLIEKKITYFGRD